jgi:hypothetical protein
MNADNPNASSLVSVTLMPAAAAARSLDRTASMRRPSAERRTLTTEAAHASTTSTQKTPNQGFGSFPSPNLVRYGPGATHEAMQRRFQYGLERFVAGIKASVREQKKRPTRKSRGRGAAGRAAA